MGSKIIDFFKFKCKKEWIISFISVFVLFYIAYSYVINNNIFVFDHLDYPEFYNYENRTYYGRWFLSVICSVGSFYDLRVINSFLAFLYLSVTCICIIQIFEIKNPVAVVLTSCLLSSFITVGVTLLWSYTVDGYFFALLLSTLPVLLLKDQFITHDKRKVQSFYSLNKSVLLRCMLSAICLCLSCGIYQAYISFYILLAIFYFINLLFAKKVTDKQAISWVRCAVVVLIVAMVFYYLIWQIVMKITNDAPSGYDGISSVGSNVFQKIASAPLRCLRDFGLYLLLGNKFTVYSIFMLSGYLFSFITFIYVLIKNKLYTRKKPFIILCILVALMPCFMFIWEFASDSINYHGLMTVCLILPLMFTIPLVEHYCDKVKLKNSVLAISIVLIFFFVTVTNIIYLNNQTTHDSTVQTELEIKIRIDEQIAKNDGVMPKKIAIVGKSKLPYENRMNENSIVELFTPFNMIYGTSAIVSYFKYVYAYDFETVSDYYYTQNYSSEINEMHCWPASDSVRIIEDTVIIKFSNDDAKK